MRSWLRRLVLVWAGGAIVALAPGLAAAHPHVFVDYTVRLMLVGDRLAGVRLTWTFDDLFSGLILQEFDQDRNGTLSAAEVQRIEGKHLAEFRRMAYYTTINVDGRPVVVPDARDFQAIAAKGLVTYEFTLPLTLSLASMTTIEVWVDDPVYYIAYLPVTAPIPSQTAGPYAVDCRVIPDKTGVTPDMVRCGIRKR